MEAAPFMKNDLIRIIFYALTALRKKLRVNHLERVLPDYPSWALGFETAIDPLDFRLTETGSLAEGFQAVWAVTWGCFQIFKFRVCNTRASVEKVPSWKQRNTLNNRVKYPLSSVCATSQWNKKGAYGDE